MLNSSKITGDARHVSGLMPMLWVSILFGVGIVTGDYCGKSVGTGMWIVIACGVVLVGLLGVKKWPDFSFLMILLAVIAFGGMRISLNEDGMEYKDGVDKETCMSKSNNARYEDKNTETCKILAMSEPVAHGKVIHFDAYVYKGSLYMREGKIRESGLEGRKVRMSLLRDTITGMYKAVHIGSFIKARAEWAFLDEWHHTTSHFSYVRWQKSRGYTRRAFVGIGKWEIQEDEWSEIGLCIGLQTRIMMFRQMIIDKLRDSGLAKDAYGVAAAMVLGDKSSLSKSIRDEYNKAGASHILALSGMHLMIIYMMLTTLFGRMRRRMELCILGLLWLYVMFVGMPISLVRAATMLSIYKVISIFGINQHQLNVIGFSAFAILFMSPQSLWDVGFQMSFTAVLFIVIYVPYLNEMKPDRWKIKKKEMSSLGKWKQTRYIVYKKLWNMGSVSVAAQLGTLPLSCYYFERIPCYFLVSNFIVIPAAVIIICIMLIMIMGCVLDIMVGGYDVVIECGGMVLELVVRVLNKSQSAISGLPGSSIEGVDVNVMQVVLMYVIICCTMALSWKMRHRMAEGSWEAPR